jgi:hypothetical protein
MAYAFIIAGALVTVITWARFEAGGSTDVPLGAGIIVGMFILCWGYGGVLNTFAPTVSSTQRFRVGMLTRTQYSAEIMPTCIRAAGVSCVSERHLNPQSNRADF